MSNEFWDYYGLIGEIKINKDKEIRIATVKKFDTKGLDIRQFYRDKEKGEKSPLLPGKGIVIPNDKLEEFLNILNHKNK